MPTSKSLWNWSNWRFTPAVRVVNSSVFKEQLGTTPQRYYMELRITEARRLLQHTELSQVDVLVACGFVSPSHFSKCYSSYFGYRPSKEKRLVK